MQGAVVTVICRRHTRNEDATFRVNVASFFSLARRVIQTDSDSSQSGKRECDPLTNESDVHDKVGRALLFAPSSCISLVG